MVQHKAGEEAEGKGKDLLGVSEEWMLTNYSACDKGSWRRADLVCALGMSLIFPNAYLYCIFEEAWWFETFVLEKPW